MKWTPEAEAAIKKVPFFVRKKVRRRVEDAAAGAGKTAVGLEDVRATQQRYLNGMAAEVKGFQLDACFGPNGCPNRAMASDDLVQRIERALQGADLLGFLKDQVGDRLKFHHEFRVTVAECPNACSQPQIKDIGIIGARMPAVTREPCTGCGACSAECPDAAVTVRPAPDRPVIDNDRCLACGKCIDACPTGTLADGVRGFKVLLAGKLGRHPRLARELPGIFDADAVVAIVRASIDFYLTHSRGGRRFAEIFTEDAFASFARRFSKTPIPVEKETDP